MIPRFNPGDRVITLATCYKGNNPLNHSEILRPAGVEAEVVGIAPVEWLDIYPWYAIKFLDGMTARARETALEKKPSAQPEAERDYISQWLRDDLKRWERMAPPAKVVSRG